MRHPAAEKAAKHRKILESATRLFKERGFNSVSVDIIMEAAGLTRRGFSSHFKSKSELIETVVTIGAEQSLALAKSFVAGGDGRAEFVMNYLSKERVAGAAEGTIESTLATDIARDPVLHAIFAQHLNLMIEEIRRRFVRGDAPHPNNEAICLLCVLVGAAQLARASKDEEMKYKIVQAVRRTADSQGLQHKRK
ncbi:TetR/AcrR family transcriptional regulator [Mesorhizobium sp. B2-1-8]|uniref:TetR/AcrR family transcriptional regulator n=1 Tax=Mesorhizobium sp. B2-1-8 TaxID=2589967 RepID=UPI001129031B|nr:TetR/AcrR family transcriptional regulator [Mesorhizobium sp. B2-1-8]UCI17906.1 TetR/AcrR family transcriptional regulator [Mesorhizobium sp. B2-1-8]